jgi:hypothetical protein
MSEQEYDRVVRCHPELRLPEYWRLHTDFRFKLMGMTPENLIAGRSAALIARDDPSTPLSSWERHDLTPLGDYKIV